MVSVTDQALNARYHQRNILKQPTDSTGCTVRQKNTKTYCCGIYNTCTVDTIRWLVTSTGPSVKIWGYRLLRGTVNTYLKGS